MGRLFWKFFLFFWLAQILTSTGVGLTIWLLRPEHGAPPLGGPPPALREPAQPGAPPPPPEHRHPPSGPGPGPGWLLRPPVMPIVLGSIVSLGFAALLAWYFSRPIRSLRAAFDAVARGRLETRVGASLDGRGDELADLGADFDRMAARLEGLIDAQRRLLHDVSHELRSPLARLQAAVDLLRQQPERGAEFAARIERDTGRMDRLVGELLTLARLDAGMAGTTKEAVDLAEIVAGVAEDAGLEGEPRACRIDVAAQSPVIVQGDPDLLHRAIENVVRNALRHSPDGGRVLVEVTRDPDGGEGRVAIVDHGPGVAESDLEAIFAPFFRGAGACASEGYGLGLAITRRIVEAHGGHVAASNRRQGGLCVVLALPTTA